MDYRNIDCGNRPDPAAFARDWGRTIITAIERRDPRLIAVVHALNKTHVNGGARAAQFQIEAADAVAWTLSRNRLDKFDFFSRFFASPAVVETMPEIAASNEGIADFEIETAASSLESLSNVIMRGGAYRQFSGSDKDASRLARDFMGAVCCAGFSETTAWHNWKPWTPWFFDVAWDGTFFWFDMRTGIATVLLITDTD